MEFKKFIPIALISSILIAGASCKKFLDVDPKLNIPDDQTIVDANSAQTAVRGIYNQLESNDYYGYTFQTLGFFSGDNVQYVGSQTVNQQLTNHAVLADLGALNSSWAAIYNTINRANNVLAKVPTLPTGSIADALKNQLLGEAYFLRALAYFDLARTWGGVQIILTPTVTDADITKLKRATLTETYAQVLKDLLQAEALLPNTTNRIRATRKTAYALHARFALYQKDWAGAVENATRLIGDTNYSLVGPYSAFAAGNTAESIFELYYTTNVTNSQGYNWQPASAGGVGWVTPTNAVVTLLQTPAVAGNRSSLIKSETIAGVTRYYGNLYTRTNGTDPAYLIRLAELYLIRAEARAQLDNPIGAAADLNAVRNRAGLGITTAVTKDDLLTAIENERRVEFAFEDHRWYDLIRTGKAQTVLNIPNANKLLLPIPYAQILIDPNLTQNPGY